METTLKTKPAQTISLMTIAAFGAIYLIWGSTYLGISLAVATLPPFLMAGSRFIIAGGVLYTYLTLRGVKQATRIQWRSAVIVGILLLLGGNGMVTWAEQQSLPSGLAALMVSVMPLWMVVIDWLRPGGKRPSGQVMVGIGLGFVGVVILIGPELWAAGEGGFPMLALAAIIFAPIAWSSGSIYAQQSEMPENPFMATAMEMLVGGLALTLVGVIAGEPARLNFSQVTTVSALAWVYLTIFGSLVAFSAYIYLLKVTTPARVSTYAYINPMIAVLLGWAVLNETLSIRIGIAAAIIVASVVIITTRQQKS